MFAAYSLAKIRDAEARAIAEFGDLELMLRAAETVADVCKSELERMGVLDDADPLPVMLLVGPGNNGGDALFAGALLAEAGYTVNAWRAGKSVHGDAWKAFLAAGGREATGRPARIHDMIRGSALLVDGLLGIGGKPGLRGPMADLAALVPGAPDIFTVAVDVVSGLAIEEPFTPAFAVPHLLADVTVTFGGRKLAHVFQPTARVSGQVLAFDLGMPEMEPDVVQLERDDVFMSIPVPSPESDKYSRGVVGVDTGSARYPGAGVLSVLGAVNAGAGFVRYTGPEPARSAVLHRAPSATLSEGRVSAWVLGCGWDIDDAENPFRLARRLSEGVPCVIDATALDLVSPETEFPENCLLTPHAGELARMLGLPRERVAEAPFWAVREAADRFGVTVLLKGATQAVAVPGNDTVLCAAPGPAWTAQAGSGDVLAGICGALLAAGSSASSAALGGASIQALTAADNPGPYPPDRLAEFIPETIAALLAPDDDLLAGGPWGE
jgi:hydroxyethylthiazole kinase-like uncharacterized protein yjeF